MPSYAHDTKDELARVFDDDENCLRAELAALLTLGSTVSEGRRDFSNVNAAVARKVITLVKKLYPDAKTEIAAVRTKKLRKSMRYFVRIFFAGSIENFLKNLNAKEILARTVYKIAALRGAFLANGSVNRPESQYHAEILSVTEDDAKFIQKIFRNLGFRAAIYARQGVFVTYMKEGDSICDFLSMIGAAEAVERFEIARNLKEVRMQVNRIVNCETANLTRSIITAQRQLADIEVLKSHGVKVREILQEAIDIRLKFSDCTMGELADKLFITREALVHRFKVIRELAEEIKSKE